MSGQDYYRVLGVARTASAAELRAAYARLAKRHHPDSSLPGTELPRRLQEVQQAYRCLSDAERRTAHDRTLDARERAHFESQRALNRRLRRYDLRHPRRAPPRDRPRLWRPVALIVIGATLVALLSRRLLG